MTSGNASLMQGLGHFIMEFTCRGHMLSKFRQRLGKNPHVVTKHRSQVKISAIHAAVGKLPPTTATQLRIILRAAGAIGSMPKSEAFTASSLSNLFNTRCAASRLVWESCPRHGSCRWFMKGPCLLASKIYIGHCCMRQVSKSPCKRL